MKRCQEQVAQAKADLFRRQLSQSNSDAVSDSDQKEALREAQKRLRHAEEKVERVKRWVPILEHATMEYHSQSQPLGDHLTGGLSHSIAVLERMTKALEGYLAVAAPEAPLLPPSEGTSAGSTTVAAPGTGTSAEAEEAPTVATAEAEAPDEMPPEARAGAATGAEPH